MLGRVVLRLNSDKIILASRPARPARSAFAPIEDFVLLWRIGAGDDNVKEVASVDQEKEVASVDQESCRALRQCGSQLALHSMSEEWRSSRRLVLHWPRGRTGLARFCLLCILFRLWLFGLRAVIRRLLFVAHSSSSRMWRAALIYQIRNGGPCGGDT